MTHRARGAVSPANGAPFAPDSEFAKGLDRLSVIARDALRAQSAGLAVDAGEDGWTVAATAERPGPDLDWGDLAARGMTATSPTVLDIPLPRGGDRPGALSCLVAAILHPTARAPLGVLIVVDEAPRDWTAADHQMLERLAETAAAEIHAARLSEQLEGAYSQLLRSDAELERQREQLYELIRIAPYFMAALEGRDPVFHITNAPFERLVGRDGLEGRRLREALPEAADQGLLHFLDQVVRTGEPMMGKELRVWLKRQESEPLEERFVSVVCHPLSGPSWAEGSVLVSGVDVTDQVIARRAAETTAADFRLMAETVRQVFWMADAEASRILYISPASEAVWGRSAGEIERAGVWLSNIAEEDRERVTAHFQPERLRAGEYDVEYRVRREDGKVRWVRERAFPVRNGDGEVQRIVGVAEDTTEQRLLEGQLRQSQKMEAIGRLASGIAHDFNNMLTAIAGHAQLLEADFDPEEPLREHVEVIRMATERSAGLTRQLLAFSRKEMLQPRIVHLQEVIRQLEPMLRRTIGEDIEMRTEVDSTLDPIYADHSQIEQVLMNLVVNARDAMPEGGRLTISARSADLDEDYFESHDLAVRTGRYALLTVADTGIGIDPSEQPHIFEPFFTTKPVDKGTGLGLSTVYGIVKQSGGLVWVYSEPGIGTSVKVYLPIQTEWAGDAEPEAAPAEAEHGAACILVVEDDRSVRRLVARVLERAGYSVLVAAGGQEATKLSSEVTGDIDLLLTDVVLPTMSGRAIAELVTEQHPGARVLFMSGYTDEAIVHHGVLDRDTHFLEKPFTPHVLLSRVQQLLGSEPT